MWHRLIQSVEIETVWGEWPVRAMLADKERSKDVREWEEVWGSVDSDRLASSQRT